jgi:hypothetical protein
MKYLLTTLISFYTVYMKKEIQEKGHIRYYHTKEPLCGRNIPVKKSGLYGSTCSECFELAQKKLRGKIV